MQNFIVVGLDRGVVLQALIALHAFTEATCAVVTGKEGKYLRFSRSCAKFLKIGFFGEDDQKFVEFVDRCSKSMSDPVLIPADCDAARMVHRVSSQLHLKTIPIPDSSMLDCFDNKWRFYQFCKKHGLSVPPTRYIGSKENLKYSSIARELGAPFIIKPVNSTGSAGVYIVSSEDDYHQQILKNESYRYSELIAQRYIEGTDVGVNLLSLHGKVTALAIQQRHFPQSSTAKISFISNKQLETAAEALAEKSGYNGVMNIDARIENLTGRIFLFESNPRFWRSVLASAWCGMNFVGESIEARPRTEKVQLSTNDIADTFFHPLFRPALWRHMLADHGHRGRIARLMMSDVCLLGASVKAILTAAPMKPPPGFELSSPYKSLKG